MMTSSRRLRMSLVLISVLVLTGCDLAAIGFPGIELQEPAPEEEPAQDDATADVACPIGTPRTYSDTVGEPRSDGRTHEGVDLLAPEGTPIYAYEDGVISQTSENSLGGITLWLQGDSGDEYYYAHLSGYVSGLSVGQEVSAGEHIAYTGDTGNAEGTTHLHFEIQPDGGDPVNPYPYVEDVCG